MTHSANIDQIGDNPLFGTAYYLPTAHQNLVSEKVIKAYYHIYHNTAESDTYFLTAKADPTQVIEFRPSKVSGLYICWIDPIAPEEIEDPLSTAEPTPELVHVNERNEYTAEEHERAWGVLLLHKSLNHIGFKSLRILLKYCRLKGCSYTDTDVTNCINIYGTCKECTAGKHTNLKIHFPDELQGPLANTGEFLHVDIMYIKTSSLRIPVLVSVEDTTNFGHAIPMKSKQLEIVQATLLMVTNEYLSYGHVISIINTDPEAVLIALKT